MGGEWLNGEWVMLCGDGMNVCMLPGLVMLDLGVGDESPIWIYYRSEELSQDLVFLASAMIYSLKLKILNIDPTHRSGISTFLTRHQTRGQAPNLALA